MDSVMRGMFKRALRKPLEEDELTIAVATGAISEEDVRYLGSLLKSFADSCPQCGYVDPSKGSVCPNCGYRSCLD